jgi:hypothetical protein
MVEKIAYLLPRKKTHNDNYICAFVCMCVCVCVGRMKPSLIQHYFSSLECDGTTAYIIYCLHHYVCHLRQRRPEETPDHLTHCLDNTYPILYLVYRPCFVCRASNCVSNSLLYGLHTF